MREQSRVEFSTELPQDQTLHPVLSDALASLDIQLEEELARYRRMRTTPERTPRRIGRRSAAKSLDLISVPSIEGKASPSEEDSLSIASVVQRDAGLHRAPAANNFGRVASNSPSRPYLGDAPAIAPNLHTSDLAIAFQSEKSPIADAEQGVPSLSGEQIDALKSQNSEGLNDYLESSEELLRSLAEEEAAVQVERSFVQSLTTPLGVGSMLLLLLSSAMFGYLVMNPSSLSQVFAFRNSNGSGGTNGEPSSQTAMVNPQPNLAAKEFKDLNLDTLGTLKPGSSSRSSSTIAPPSLTPSTSKPNAASTSPGKALVSAQSTEVGGTQAGASSAPASRSEPAPVAPSQPAPAVKTYAPPQPARSATAPSHSAAVRTYTSAPAKAAAPPVARKSTPVTTVSPSSQPNPSNPYDYKVVTQYDGDRNFEAVKKVVPDAYVRNFPDGARVQLGASTSQAEAEAKVQELRKQGISAEVYKP